MTSSLPVRGQRLILLYDGTWNDPQDRTNVFRLASLLKEYDGAIRQRFFYHEGVGASRITRFRGGLFGYGLTHNLLAGYQWLSKHHAAGDEIWLFGFSRGAYTARSLAGLIRKCGLLKIYTPKLLAQAVRLYRDKTLHPDCEECRAFRAQYSKSVRIKFIGVWDTVGALGVPGTFISEFGKYAWHDTTLSSLVDYAYHAMALDEHREVYDAALWVNDGGEQKAGNLAIEQRWFVGAHANVGGGYGSVDPLADPPLKWMLDKAAAAGLKLDDFAVARDAWRALPNDSFKEFMYGVYAIYRKIRTLSRCGRYFRKLRTGRKGAMAVNVSVDESVRQRQQAADLHYRPPTLLEE